jgi:hypothetical protein
VWCWYQRWQQVTDIPAQYGVGDSVHFSGCTIDDQHPGPGLFGEWHDSGSWIDGQG